MTNLLFTSAALMFLQVGPNPAANDTLGVPEELRDRPARTQVDQRSTLTECLRQTTTNPQAALDTAQRWREYGETDLDFAQSAHCLGLALVKLERMVEAQQAFELASAEASRVNVAYAARLAAMAGNAAVSGGDVEGAIALLDRAGGMALAEGQNELAADLRVDLARVLVRAGRQDDAALALAEAREADMMDAEAWLLSATLSRRLERLGEAFDQIRRAALLDPRNPQIGLEAGVIAALSGRGEDARASFESVLRVAPGTPAAERAQSYLDQLNAPTEPEPIEE
ncbi:hypothetical protein [Qipengyuania sphaerica]|uniref:hypothetical protein n=1 Tax=Qipengyuania sphaerica TaxID=2867243 RepID=UPI001C888D5E|nr:hypothetical protein [Qipengyuania sphaerica]MBX7541643.1 hypothetical protein [Qipengyuania sphaerica]